FETPVIERLDNLKAKFAAGEESDAFKEIFTFKDQGERDLGLRFELTLSLCRFIAMNPNIKLPFKRYEIGRVYRDGPVKLGRMREFWQCDVDIIGSDSMLADAQVLAIVKEVFNKLDFEITIEVSNRKLLNGILEYSGVSEEKRHSAMISIDKLKKIGAEEVNTELKEKGIKKQAIERINKILNIKGTRDSRIDKLKKLIDNDTGKQGIKELEELFEYLDFLKVKSYEFNHTLARGLGYYTGPIYEAFLKDSKITSSVVGGGRYDEYIGNFLGKTREIPATGLSFGLEPITEAVKLRQKEFPKSVSQVFIIPIGTKEKSLEILQTLRKAGINVETDVMKRGISKNLDYANVMGIPYVIFIGENELKQDSVKLKHMKSGKEEMVKLDELVSSLKERIDKL
ncbi:histidine--tRNA ligase, partial [Candidatus Woesearchaeota archaeon]|nr:histidine--tRNA ligase [Candidatus Woesearchaeota archaeon]